MIVGSTCMMKTVPIEVSWPVTEFVTCQYPPSGPRLATSSGLLR